MKRTPTVILSTRGLALSAALAFAGGAACGVVPVAVSGQYEPAGGGPRVPVRAQVQSEHRADGPRYIRGAVASLATLTGWIGAPPPHDIVLVDPPLHASAPADPSAIVLERTPWWSSDAAMAPELASARGVARRIWAETIDPRGLPGWFLDGLAEYTARRAVADIFTQIDDTPAYAMLDARFLGGFVPRFVRLRLRPERDGEPLSAYVSRPRTDAHASASSADDRRSLAAKTVLTLNTLERWVGRPAFDAAIAAFVGAARTAPPTLDDFMRAASATTGQDLAWMLEPMLRGTAIYDYAVAELTSRPASGGGFETAVTVERRGDGLFTGSTAPRVGPFESGRGLTIAVAFDDGERVIDTWDGRDSRKTLRYRSPARAASATIDPDRKLVLDVHTTNNSRAIAPKAGTAAAHWSLRWMLWLEHALLTYGALA